MNGASIEQNPAPPDLRVLLTGLGLEISKQINCARIGNLLSFDPVNQTAVVQIAQQQITGITPEGAKTFQPFSPLLNVPVFILGGGGYSATFPFAAGDECLVVFNDRELDNWVLAGGTQTAPTTLRIHDLSDGMCFIGFRSYPRSLAGYSTTSAQVRSDDGETYVEIANGGIVNIVAPTSITLTAPTVEINASSAAIIHSAAKVSFDANGTGVVYTPALISTYTDGVPTAHHSPNPPGPL